MRTFLRQSLTLQSFASQDFPPPSGVVVLRVWFVRLKAWLGLEVGK